MNEFDPTLANPPGEGEKGSEEVPRGGIGTTSSFSSLEQATQASSIEELLNAWSNMSPKNRAACNEFTKSQGIVRSSKD